MESWLWPLLRLGHGKTGQVAAQSSKALERPLLLQLTFGIESQSPAYQSRKQVAGHPQSSQLWSEYGDEEHNVARTLDVKRVKHLAQILPVLVAELHLECLQRVGVERSLQARRSKDRRHSSPHQPSQVTSMCSSRGGYRDKRLQIRSCQHQFGQPGIHCVQEQWSPFSEVRTPA